MTKEAIRRQPDTNGFCPILVPGEYCLDSVHNVWHFFAPDGQRFSVNSGETRKGAAVVVQRGLEGVISFFKDLPPEKAYWRGKIVDCKWVVRNGFWVELPAE